MEEQKKPTGLELLRVPFPQNQISKLPKPTKQQTKEVQEDFKKGVRCEVCGGWHHPKAIHLDYVGHAALTDRLLDADPSWNWEPLSFNDKGFPRIDENGGMWIRLTVCGVTRLGYGHSDGKSGGDAIKELIGDALRNAAMRFGAALDLWHKGNLHDDDVVDGYDGEAKKPQNNTEKKLDYTKFAKDYNQELGLCDTKEKLDSLVKRNAVGLSDLFKVYPDWHAKLSKNIEDKRSSLGA